MKVQLTDDMKDVIRMSELPIVKRIIKEAKEDCGDKDYAMMAANCYGYVKKLFDYSFEIAGNATVRNVFFYGSEHFDIWVRFTAQLDDGFVTGGCYLTDIWNLDGSDEMRDTLKRHAYVRKATFTD